MCVQLCGCLHLICRTDRNAFLVVWGSHCMCLYLMMHAPLGSYSWWCLSPVSQEKVFSGAYGFNTVENEADKGKNIQTTSVSCQANPLFSPVESNQHALLSRY